MASAKKFYESLVDSLNDVSSEEELAGFAWFICNTEIPRNHEAIEYALLVAANEHIKDSSADTAEVVLKALLHLKNEKQRVAKKRSRKPRNSN